MPCCAELLCVLCGSGCSWWTALEGTDEGVLGPSRASHGSSAGGQHKSGGSCTQTPKTALLHLLAGYTLTYLLLLAPVSAPRSSLRQQGQCPQHFLPTTCTPHDCSTCCALNRPCLLHAQLTGVHTTGAAAGAPALHAAKAADASSSSSRCRRRSCAADRR